MPHHVYKELYVHRVWEPMPMDAERLLISLTFISVFKVLVWKWFNHLGAKCLIFVVEKTSALLSYRLCKESIGTSTEEPPILDYTIPCVGGQLWQVCDYVVFAYPNSPHLPNSAGCWTRGVTGLAPLRAAWVSQLLVICWDCPSLTLQTKLERTSLL